MSSSISRVVSLGLFVLCGVCSAVGCSSSDAKKAAPTGDAGDGGDAGAQSEGGAHHAGAGGKSGAGGTSGAAGAPSEAGASGESSAGQGGAAGESNTEGGAAGAAALSCEPSGTVTSLTLPDGAVYPACRDAIIQPSYALEASSNEFTCCGVSDTAEPYGAELVGLPDGDAGGVFAFHVPADAPTGVQSLTVTCTSGALSGKITYSVSSVVKAPVLTSASSTIATNEAMVVTGQNLAGVGDAVAVTSTGLQYACAIDHDATTETSLTCSFDGIPAGSYRLRLRKDCGYAVETWPFQVVQTL